MGHAPSGPSSLPPGQACTALPRPARHCSTAAISVHVHSSLRSSERAGHLRETVSGLTQGPRLRRDSLQRAGWPREARPSPAQPSPPLPAWGASGSPRTSSGVSPSTGSVTQDWEGGPSRQTPCPEPGATSPWRTEPARRLGEGVRAAGCHQKAGFAPTPNPAEARYSAPSAQRPAPWPRFEKETPRLFLLAYFFPEFLSLFRLREERTGRPTLILPPHSPRPPSGRNPEQVRSALRGPVRPPPSVRGEMGRKGGWSSRPRVTCVHSH